MFGLENKKDKDKNKVSPSEEIVFDLEKDLLDKAKKRKIIEIIEKRLQKIKDLLRAGVEQEDVNQLGIIFNGYNSMLKVIVRPVVTKQ